MYGDSSFSTSNVEDPWGSKLLFKFSAYVMFIAASAKTSNFPGHFQILVVPGTDPLFWKLVRPISLRVISNLAVKNNFALDD